MIRVLLLSYLAGHVALVAGHATLWHPSMWGFNVTATLFSYDNRPVVPLMEFSYSKWWMHNHLDYPPEDGVFLELPAGGTLNSEIACDKGATSYFASSSGGDVQSGNDPCPGSPTTAFHANNEADTRGCGLGIAYKSDVNDLKPEDFTIFTVNHTCVWNRYTDFQVPADLPACPDDGCICSFNWIHAPDSGSAQMFFNGYRCKVTNGNSNKQVATPRLARRCGQNSAGDANVVPWNCTYGAKQALYWMQTEDVTFFEGAHDPPFYNDLYNFPDGAQNDIFQDSQLPTFDESGSQTGFTTLGGSTATTANIVQPTISSGWPTTTSAASGGSSDSVTSPSSSSSSSSSESSPTSTSSSSSGSITTSAAETSSSSSSTSSTSTSSPAAETTSAASSKCRKRDVGLQKQKRAFGAHKKMSKRYDTLF